MQNNKKRYGILSCNIYCNFTNYGSALQTYALQKAIDSIYPQKIEAVVVDYCPDVLKEVDILNPLKIMWDQDEESQLNCRLSLDSIRINKEKFDNFFKTRYNLSAQKYTSNTLDDCLEKESLSGYVVGSDTVFCLEEFKLDNGYFANYETMRHHSVSYAASFGDSRFDEHSYAKLNILLKNFKALGIREYDMIPYIKEHVSCPVARTIDPTLLLTKEDYAEITAPREYEEPYMLMYTRRYNEAMEKYARDLAERNGWKFVEISLRATNADKGSVMRYDAGVEEFLSLIKHSEMVVTNSFHGMIFSVIFEKDFVAFSRNECDTKISELLELFGIADRLMVNGKEDTPSQIDYAKVHQRIGTARIESLNFLKKELLEYIND
ncbi:MAG: polysaccharide pyruvyl transferase family protein [Muribaculaceae bacterium]|nr:polysaccharide pyruvyl transferase family protein [Muribaculaceae bacterium]